MRRARSSGTVEPTIWTAGHDFTGKTIVFRVRFGDQSAIPLYASAEEVENDIVRDNLIGGAIPLRISKLIERIREKPDNYRIDRKVVEVLKPHFDAAKISLIDPMDWPSEHPHAVIEFKPITDA